MRTRMDDTVEVKVKVIELPITRGDIWIPPGCVDWHVDAFHFLRLLLDDAGDNLGILLREPSEQRWDTHDVCYGTLHSLDLQR